MAKNTSSSAFRKIDVDRYNEDNFKEDEIDSNGVVPFPDDAEITKLLNVGKNIDALKLVLENAPLGSKNHQAKVSNLNMIAFIGCVIYVWLRIDTVFWLQEYALQLILRVLLSIKPHQMDGAIDSLNNIDLADILMKYIYRGFEMPSDGSSAHLLQWHEKVYARYGVGCITRVLTCTNRA